MWIKIYTNFNVSFPNLDSEDIHTLKPQYSPFVHFIFNLLPFLRMRIAQIYPDIFFIISMEVFQCKGKTKYVVLALCTDSH